jgi:hypothetical protein
VDFFGFWLLFCFLDSGLALDLVAVALEVRFLFLSELKGFSRSIASIILDMLEGLPVSAGEPFALLDLQLRSCQRKRIESITCGTRINRDKGSTPKWKR